MEVDQGGHFPFILYIGLGKARSSCVHTFSFTFKLLTLAIWFHQYNLMIFNDCQPTILTVTSVRAYPVTSPISSKYNLHILHLPQSQGQASIKTTERKKAYTCTILRLGKKVLKRKSLGHWSLLNRRCEKKFKYFHISQHFSKSQAQGQG